MNEINNNITISNGNIRQNNYDVLRIISTIAVIMIHTNWLFFSKRYLYYDNSIIWNVESIFNIISRFSVPCFVMMSGSYNLNESNNSISFYKKTSFKIFFPSFVVMLFLVIFQIVFNLLSNTLWYIGIGGIFTGNFFNLWYIYMLAVLYIMTPLIISIRSKIGWRKYKTMTYIGIIWAVLSQASSNQTIAYSIGVCIAYVFYYMLGDVINTERENGKIQFLEKNKIFIIFIMLICIIITYFIRKSGFNYYIENAYTNFFSPTIVIYSVCVYILFGFINIKNNYSQISGKMFYLYLFHTIIYLIINKILNGFQLNEVMYILLLTILTFIFGYITSVMFNAIWLFIINRLKLKMKWFELKIWDIIK